MKLRSQTGCPVCYSLDVFGDKWTLLILRDLLVYQKRYYREFLGSGEGISTNILADRLRELVEQGIVTKEDDPKNKSQTIYRPTRKALDFLPILGAMADWGLRYNPDTKKRANPVLKQLKEDPDAFKTKLVARLAKELEEGHAR